MIPISNAVMPTQVGIHALVETNTAVNATATWCSPNGRPA
jgi:hypothetical protein